MSQPHRQYRARPFLDNRASEEVTFLLDGKEIRSLKDDLLTYHSKSSFSGRCIYTTWLWYPFLPFHGEKKHTNEYLSSFGYSFRKLYIYMIGTMLAIYYFSTIPDAALIK